jgi:hypothetical protein
MPIKRFNLTNINKFKPREDEETRYNFDNFLANPEFKKFLTINAELYKLTKEINGKEETLCLFGGYRTMIGTAELLLCPSIYFDRNVLACIRELRKAIDTRKYIPADIHRIEINCKLEYPAIINFAIKGLRFSSVGIRTRFGAGRTKDDYLLLEKILYERIN